MSKKTKNESILLDINDKQYLQKKEALTSFFLDKSYVKMTKKQIVNILNIKKEQVYTLDSILDELETKGLIYIDDSKRYVPFNMSNDIVKCVYQAKNKKFGFGILDSKENDIYISSELSLFAMDGDDILVKITKPSVDGKKREGKVIKIIKRNTKTVIGEFSALRNFGFVIPINSSINDIYIPKKYISNVKDGMMVEVEIKKYETATSKAEGIITSIIGNKNDENIYVKALYKSYFLDELDTFNVNVQTQLQNVSDVVLENEKEGRVDRTNSKIFTIDGKDAKDLDDGVFVEKKEDGNYLLSVYIADVSHYVKTDSPLDKEAIRRGTSTYIPGSVIPMLPKKLSNGICSLNEKVERLSLAIDILIDKAGNVLNSNIFKAVIKVTKRMSYEDVYKVFEKSDENILKEYSEYVNDLEIMRELATILKQKRINNGSINFDIPETKVVLDELGQVIDVKAYEKNIANDIIEEFMLAANMEVAKTFFFLNAPFIYRIHEKPDEEKLRELNMVLSNYKKRIKGIKDIKPKTLATILDSITDENEKKIVSNFMLRTLKIAKYNETCEGHFGLSARYYCHFTSPIRRYPDLFIHRVISDYIDNNYVLSDEKINNYMIQAVKYSKTSSDAEKNATSIERDFDDLYKVLYMKKFGMKKEYEATISSVTSFGIFVTLENTIEGLVPFALMPDYDYYEYDDLRKILIGRNTGEVYKIGDKVKVRSSFCDVRERRIDFQILEK